MFGVFYEGGQLCNIVKNSTEFEEYARLNNENMKKAYKYDLDGNFIQEYKSVKEAGKLNNCDPSSIAKICRGLKETCHNFRWSYEKMDKLPDIKKRVYQYSTDGDFIKEFRNTSEAFKEIGRTFDVDRACTGVIVTSAGFQWRYEKFDKLEKVIIRKYKPESLIEVHKYDLEWNYICTYKGVRNAAKANNCLDSAISGVFSGKNKSSGGFKWSKTLITK